MFICWQSTYNKMTTTNSSADPHGLHVCWVDTMRYTNPLSASQAKKWALITETLGVTITVTSFAPGLRPRRFTQSGTHFLLYPQLPSPPLRYLTVYCVVPLLVAWLIVRGRADVLIAHDPYIGGAAALAKQLARLFGRRAALVIETRGDLEQGLFMQRKVTFKAAYRAAMRQAARFALRHVDALRAVSGSSRGQLVTFMQQHVLANQTLFHDGATTAIDGVPLLTFMSWTDADAFRDVQPEQPPSQRHDIVYAGVLVPRKGVHHLLDAFTQLAAEFPNTHLWIIGKASTAAYATSLHTQIDSAGLAQRVTFVDHVGQDQLARYMAQGRVFVLPTYSEGLPKVVVEAMLTGTPVIASAVDGIPEVLHDGVSGWLIPAGDLPALVNALRDAFTSADVDALGKAARAFALDYFSPEHYVQRYGELFAAAYQHAHMNTARR